MESFIDLISQKMSLQGDKIAIVCQQESITYNELERRSNQLAHYLVNQGQPSGALIAVMMDRSIDLMVTLLGILKAGCAYVPIDPAFPTERIEYMLNHSQIRTVLSDQDYPVIPVGINTHITAQLNQIPGSSSDKRPEITIQKNTPAYVIYTSGSTGVPKGVVVPHGAVSNFLNSMLVTPGFNSDDILLAVTTLSFDIAVLELFLPLLAGAQLVIADPATSSNGSELAQLIKTAKISVMQATPATWKILFDTDWSGEKSLRVFIGGEAPGKKLINQLVQSCAEVWNMYGPTETTVWSTCYQIKAVDSPILIGGPIANTQLYVLDKNLQKVVSGSEGELYIGGEGVTTGYLFSEALTQENFITNPFNTDANTIIYKTGDLVRMTDSGLLEYRGRMDNQFKLRGYRIEFEEIEFHLDNYSAISQSVATVIEVDDDKFLVAYFVSKAAKTELTAEKTLELKKLREYLSQYLPEYMLPQYFVEIEKIPLTPNGKIDRKGLPEFSYDAVIADNNYTAPRNEVERIIAEIWQTVLGISPISIDSDFFSLGGHSLLITKIWMKVQRELGVELELGVMFECGTIAELAKVVNGATKTEISECIIPQYSRMKSPALSSAQKRFWYIQQITENSIFYNLYSAYRLEGKLDIGILEKSFNEIIKRHEILRTSLDWSAETPKQLILPHLNYKLPVEHIDDAGNVDIGEQQLLAVLDKKIKEVIDLDKAPLFKACLFSLSDNSHVLFFMPHHVIWDGGSFDLFLNELKVHYEAIAAGAEAELAELPIQYADYAEWHNSVIKNNSLSSKIEFWKKNLQGDLPVLNMPLDHPRPAQFSFNGAIEYFSFDKKTVTGLAQIAQQQSTTVNIVLLTIYFILLGRYSGQKDIIIGTPVQGRLLPEIESLLGVFVNTLCIRVDLSGNPSFGEMLERVKSASLAAYQHQEVPFENLVEALEVERDLSRTPIFQTLFTFQEVSARQSQIGDVSLSQINLHNGSSPTDISCWLESSPSKLAGSIEYNSDLFDGTRIKSLISHFENLSKSVIESLDTAIEQLNMLSSQESKALQQQWNTTETVQVKSNSIIKLIDKQLESRGEGRAVTAAQSSLTYQELNQSANRLAHYLLAKGAGSGQIIGVCVDRTEVLLVAMLAILKTGAAYLPIDPNYPVERNRYILGHAKVTLMLSQSQHQSCLVDLTNELLCLDQLDQEIASQSDQSPEINIKPDDIAYVIYTSGSSGRPKGVLVPHGAVVNFLCSMAKKPGLNVDDRVLAITTLSFDIHVLELLLPLSVGAEIILLSSEEGATGSSIIDALNQFDVTLMQATPSTWRLLLGCEWKGKANLKGLIGGEAAPQELMASLNEKVAELWNMYGPTETTVWSSCYLMEKGQEQDIRIGYPIDNTQLYVLDQANQLSPVGIPGELCIGGAGLSRGYLNDLENTEKSFIEYLLPHSSEKINLYRTGDLVVRHANGALEYISRIDNQIKVRGFRIELGEIELALLDIEPIKEALVVVREDQPGDQRIVAYYLPNSNVNLTITELRNSLKRQLPVYMIPQHLVQMPAFPKTLNGKIDRGKLPLPYSIANNNEKVEPPVSENEKLIASLWQGLTGAKQINRSDNFFYIGGHSLLSLEFLFKVQRETDVHLTPKDVVFNDLKQLASIIDTQTTKSDLLPAARNKSSMLGRLMNRLK